MTKTKNRHSERRRLMDLKQTASYLAVSYWTARSLILDGKIPHLRCGRKILTDQQDLDGFIETEKQVGV